ncbi:MAG: hypothetical protein AABZ28_04265 [Nitrospinota bacterium]
MEICPLNIYIKIVEKVIMPSPPNWTSISRTLCPNIVRSFPVSTTVRPVTQTAEVAIKSESEKDKYPFLEEMGREKRKVPMAIRTAKLIIAI